MQKECDLHRPSFGPPSIQGDTFWSTRGPKHMCEHSIIGDRCEQHGSPHSRRSTGLTSGALPAYAQSVQCLFCVRSRQLRTEKTHHLLGPQQRCLRLLRRVQLLIWRLLGKSSRIKQFAELQAVTPLCLHVSVHVQSSKFSSPALGWRLAALGLRRSYQPSKRPP